MKTTVTYPTVAALLLTQSVSLHAATTHFVSSLSYVLANGVVDDTQDPTVFVRQANINGTTAGTSLSNTGPTGSAGSIASADVSSGALRAISTTRARGNTAFAFTRVDIGDSFRAVSGDGSPFAWSAADVGKFTFNVTGVIDRLGNGDNFSRFGVTLLDPGTIGAYAAWAAGTGPASGWTGHVIGSSFIGLGYDVGSGDPSDFFLDGNLTSFPGIYDVDFNPEGDFDWVVTLITHTKDNGGFLVNGFPVSRNNADFSNTLSITYQGPEGTTTLSGSGVFPGTLPIPEPSSALLAALAAFPLLRRRRDKSRTSRG